MRRDTEQIDYDELRRLARAERPRMIQCGTTAYSRTLDFDAFRAIADEVGAVLFADIAHIAGLVATGAASLARSARAHIVTTTTHKTLRGPRGGMILCDAAYAKKIDSAVFPGGQGGPLMHVIAAKAVALPGGGSAPPSATTARRSSPTRARWRSALADAGFRVVSGGTDTHLFLLSLVGRELTGKAAEAALERAGITVEQEHGALRSAQARGDLGRAHRHAGGDDARHARARDGGDRAR